MAEKEPVVLDWWLLSPLEVVGLGLPIASSWIHIDPGVLRGREQANTGWLEGSKDPEQMLDSFLARAFWRNDLVVDELVDEVLAQLDSPARRGTHH